MDNSLRNCISNLFPIETVIRSDAISSAVCQCPKLEWRWHSAQVWCVPKLFQFGPLKYGVNESVAHVVPLLKVHVRMGEELQN